MKTRRNFISYKTILVTASLGFLMSCQILDWVGSSQKYSLLELRKMQWSFRQEQKSALKKLQSQQVAEQKSLKTQLDTELKDWEKKEKELRHLYFKEHSQGSDRRTYIQDFLKRRQDKLNDITSRKTALLDRHKRELNDLKETQKQALKKYNQELIDGVPSHE